LELSFYFVQVGIVFSFGLGWVILGQVAADLVGYTEEAQVGVGSIPFGYEVAYQCGR
jgi:hypothetical protein